MEYPIRFNSDIKPGVQEDQSEAAMIGDQGW